MKTESEVAQENLKSYKTLHITFKALTQHKESCERFLEFLEIFARAEVIFPKGYDLAKYAKFNENKILDLKQTIKIYKEAGI